MIWGPWKYKGTPAIGDYINVQGWNERDECRFDEVGIVAGRNKRYVWFLGEKPTDGEHMTAKRWRAGQLPEFNPPVKAKMEEPV